MTDLEEEPHECHRVHVIAGAARPRHTLLGSVRRTRRWTLRVVVHGHYPHDGFNHVSTPTGRRVSLYDTLYSDN
jgi:hypothetical protein